MPYVSAAERERQRWMTLKEALGHIQRVDECDENSAFEQLRAPLADGAVVCSRQLSGAPVPFAKPRERAGFWKAVRFDLVGQNIYWYDFREVFNEDEEEDVDDEDLDLSRVKRIEHPICRVWLLKESIFKIWTGNKTERAPPAPREATSDQPRKLKNQRA